MKNYRLAILSALAVGSLAGLNASAQFSYTQGDLLLGIRTPGTGNDMVVDLGSAASLVTAATVGGGSTGISGSFYTSAQFTASGLDINNLYFSVFGDTSGNTLWATAATTLNEHNAFSQVIAANQGSQPAMKWYFCPASSSVVLFQGKSSRQWRLRICTAP